MTCTETISPSPGSPAVHTTPSGAGRDGYVDLLKVAALAAVVLWHWVFTIATWDDGPHTSNIVAPHTWLWWVTWITPMPLFFITGGWASRRSLDRLGTSRFVKSRVKSLLVPVLPLVAAAGAIWCALGVLVDKPAPWRAGLVLSISHLWFIATYLIVVMCAPLMRALSRKSWAAPFVLLAAASVAIDWARFGTGRAGWQWISLPVVWGFIHQLGIHFDTIRRWSQRSLAIGAAICAVVLLLLTSVGPYSRPMVGVPGGGESNLGPTTFALLTLGVFQMFLAAWLAPYLGRATRLLGAARRASAHSMEVFLWHLPAFVIVFGAWLFLRAPLPATDTATWLITRPIWFAASVGVTAALIRTSRALTASRNS